MRINARITYTSLIGNVSERQAHPIPTNLAIWDVFEETGPWEVPDPKRLGSPTYFKVQVTEIVPAQSESDMPHYSLKQCTKPKVRSEKLVENIL